MVQIKKGIIAFLAVITAVIFTGCSDNSSIYADLSTIDLTDLPASTRYVYLNDMLYKIPSVFVGKTIIAEGQYALRSGINYVYVKDVCCSQYIQIDYGSMYPPQETFVRVEGVYSKLDSGGGYYIDVTEFEVK